MPYLSFEENERIEAAVVSAFKLGGYAAVVDMLGPYAQRLSPADYRHMKDRLDFLLEKEKLVFRTGPWATDALGKSRWRGP